MTAARPPLSKHALVLLCVAVGATGCSVQQAAPVSPRSVMDLTQIIQRPGDLPALLANIKTAFDRALPLRDSFYRDEVLTHLFGGRKIISWSKPEDVSERSGEMSSFGGFAGPILVQGAQLEGISLRFRKVTQPNNRSMARVTISIAGKTDVDFQAVERIFGTRWVSQPLRAPSPHGVFRPPTRPHGNEEIVYSFGSGGANWTAYFEFKVDATVFAATSTIEGPSLP